MSDRNCRTLVMSWATIKEDTYEPHNKLDVRANGNTQADITNTGSLPDKDARENLKPFGYSGQLGFLMNFNDENRREAITSNYTRFDSKRFSAFSYLLSRPDKDKEFTRFKSNSVAGSQYARIEYNVEMPILFMTSLGTTITAEKYLKLTETISTMMTMYLTKPAIAADELMASDNFIVTFRDILGYNYISVSTLDQLFFELIQAIVKKCAPNASPSTAAGFYLRNKYDTGMFTDMTISINKNSVMTLQNNRYGVFPDFADMIVTRYNSIKTAIDYDKGPKIAERVHDLSKSILLSYIDHFNPIGLHGMTTFVLPYSAPYKNDKIPLYAPYRVESVVNRNDVDLMDDTSPITTFRDNVHLGHLTSIFSMTSIGAVITSDLAPGDEILSATVNYRACAGLVIVRFADSIDYTTYSSTTQVFDNQKFYDGLNSIRKVYDTQESGPYMLPDVHDQLVLANFVNGVDSNKVLTLVGWDNYITISMQSSCSSHDNLYKIEYKSASMSYKLSDANDTLMDRLLFLPRITYKGPASIAKCTIKGLFRPNLDDY